MILYFIKYNNQLIPCTLTNEVNGVLYVKTKKIINKDVGYLVTDSTIRNIITKQK